jgi:hypothetical protein
MKLFNDAVIAETESLIRGAWETAEGGRIPPPLEDSPKCVKCSLAGICLPDETRVSGLEEAVEDPLQLPLFGEVPRKPQKHDAVASGGPE